MRRWRKIRTIAAFEFFAAVKRVGYLITTFGMPLFMVAYGSVIAIPASYVDRKAREPVVYGVVDAAGVLNLQNDLAAGYARLPDEMRRALEASGHGQTLGRVVASSNFVFRPFEREQEARTALVERRLKGFFVVPADYMATGRIEVYSPEALTFSAGDSRDAFGHLLRTRLTDGRIPTDVAARVLQPIRTTKVYAVSRSGELRDGGVASSFVRLAVPLLFMLLFLLSILMTSGYLMQGTAVEKENKVVEVLLASANPDEILAGKLLGLGAAGLLQIAVWLLMMLATGLGIVPLLVSSTIEVPWRAVVLAIPFFALAFLFFGGLILGTGSLGSNVREAQQLAMVWSLMAALPMMLIAVLLKEPHGAISRVLTLVPFTAGPIIVLRASTDADLLAWWEVAVALVLLAAATWLGLRLGGRLFRIGLLSAGARPSLREIVRQARLAA